MKVTIATISDSGVFTLDVSEDLEIENFKVIIIYTTKLLLLLHFFIKFFFINYDLRSSDREIKTKIAKSF